MSNIKKGNLGKKLLIAFCIMAAILTTAGIIIICNRPHTGTEQVLAGNTSLQEKIYQDTDVLSDEEFIYGITNMIPSDNTDDSVITSALAALKQAYMNTVGVDCYAEYINYFGTPAAYLKLPDTIELTKVLTPLQQDTVFTKIYVLLADSELGVVHTEYVYSDGEISEVYLPHMLTPTDASEDIKQLADSLIAEYNLTPEDFKYSGGELEINVEILSNSDALMPLAGCRDSVPAGAWGNAPTVTPLNLLKEKSQAWHLGCRQRSVPAHKLPLPQERNPPSAKKVNYGSVRCEGVKGATADFVCSHCPLVASAEAKPSATQKSTCLNPQSRKHHCLLPQGGFSPCKKSPACRTTDGGN